MVRFKRDFFCGSSGGAPADCQRHFFHISLTYHCNICVFGAGYEVCRRCMLSQTVLAFSKSDVLAQLQKQLGHPLPKEVASWLEGGNGQVVAETKWLDIHPFPPLTLTAEQLWKLGKK